MPCYGPESCELRVKASLLRYSLSNTAMNTTIACHYGTCTRCVAIGLGVESTIVGPIHSLGGGVVGAGGGGGGGGGGSSFYNIMIRPITPHSHTRQ